MALPAFLRCQHQESLEIVAPGAYPPSSARGDLSTFTAPRASSDNGLAEGETPAETTGTSPLRKVE